MSHWRILKKIDEFGQDFDKLVCEWKSNLEHSCKKEKVLSTLTEVVEEAEMEIIPGGMATINVADIGLTFHSVLSNSHGDDVVLQGADVEDGASLKVREVKERVRLKIGNNFDKQVFDSLVDEIVKTNMPLCLKALKELEEKVLLQHPPTFQITGDNLDLMVKVKHMSASNQNNIIHWVNLNAVKNRVLANHLSNDNPVKSVLELEKVEFLPSPEDNEAYLQNITALATRVVVRNIPAFSQFKDIVVKHILHEYSDVMKEKSDLVSIHLIFSSY